MCQPVRSRSGKHVSTIKVKAREACVNHYGQGQGSICQPLRSRSGKHMSLNSLIDHVMPEELCGYI